MTINGVIQRIDIYNTLYRTMLYYYIEEGYSHDKSSRKSNIFAVKNTNVFYNTLNKYISS